MADPTESSRSAFLDARFFPHLVDLVFDFCAEDGRTGDWDRLLAWRLTGKDWSERTDAVLFRHIVVSDAGYGGSRLPVIAAPARSGEAGKVSSLPIQHSASSPVYPWDSAWRRGFDRLVDRLKFTQVVDYYSAASFKACDIPGVADEDIGNLYDALANVAVVRRPWPALLTLPTPVVVDVLELCNPIHDDVHNNYFPHPYGMVGAVPPSASSELEGSTEAVLIMRIGWDWIRRPFAEVSLRGTPYKSSRLTKITVVFEIEPANGQCDTAVHDAISPQLGAFVESLWHQCQALVFVGLEEADPRAFGLPLMSDVVEAFHKKLDFLDNGKGRGSLTPVTFLTRDEYRILVGSNAFELYTSTRRMRGAHRPSVPERAEPVDTVPRLVAKTFWRPGATAKDRAAALALRGVSKRWKFDADSAIFHHVIFRRYDKEEKPPANKRADFFSRYQTLLEESSETGDVADGPPRRFDDLWVVTLYMALEDGEDGHCISSPAGRLPLLFEWWSVEPTPKGIKRHACSVADLVCHARVADLCGSTDHLLIDLGILVPSLQVLRYTDVSATSGMISHTAAELIVSLCDATSTTPSCFQSAPFAGLEPRLLQLKTGSMRSITLNVIYDTDHLEDLRDIRYDARSWRDFSINKLVVLFSPVKTSRRLSAKGAIGASSASLLEGALPTTPDTPHRLSFFPHFWSSFLASTSCMPLSVTIVGLEAVPRVMLGVPEDVTACQLTKMVLDSAIDALLRRVHVQNFPSDVAASAAGAPNIKLLSIREYCAGLDEAGHRKFALARDARPSYWP